MNASDIALYRRFFGKGLIQEAFFYDASGRLEYHGIAKRGAATSEAAWWVEKWSYTGDSSSPDTIKVAPEGSILDNRASLVYA